MTSSVAGSRSGQHSGCRVRPETSGDILLMSIRGKFPAQTPAGDSGVRGWTGTFAGRALDTVSIE